MSVSKYKPLNNIVCVIIIIRKVIVSVSKYKPLNNIRYLRNNCFFLQCRLEFVEQLWIHYVLAGVRSRFNIINRKLLRVLTIIIIISKATVSVSKYKRLNNNKYLCNNCFFYNVVLSSSNSWEFTMCLLSLGAGST